MALKGVTVNSGGESYIKRQTIPDRRGKVAI